MPEACRITVLLVDDHSLVRRGFRRMLEDDPEIRVVGEASDGHEAVEQAASNCSPHVVVMDFALPSMNGAVATRHDSASRVREIAVLILSMHAEHNLRAHVSGCGRARISAEERVDLELVDAVKQVAAGEQVLDPRLGRLADEADRAVA